MIEAVFAVVVVGVMAVASTAVFGSVARARFSQQEGRLGTLLAQQLMTEILAEPFQQPGASPGFGPRSGQTRATYDAVDCYNGYSASPPVSMAGTVLPGYTGWKQQAAVTFVTPASPNTATGTTTTLKRVTVTVTAPSGRTYTQVGWRSKFGAYEQLTPSTLTTYVTGVSVTVQGDSPTKPVQTGAHPLNITTTQ